MPRAEAIRQVCKLTGTRWVDIDKGDEKTPDYRSRLVATEFNNGQEEGLYASTPPLEALRFRPVLMGCPLNGMSVSLQNPTKAYQSAPQVTSDFWSSPAWYTLRTCGQVG